eukprot:GHVN01031838.1.p1 GENE.GHVN01031838.1~~GHVN01031838.1.p1  ORF type:complete len:741 (+),score=165.42 GHVN01031838.1:277-2499(+)
MITFHQNHLSPKCAQDSDDDLLSLSPSPTSHLTYRSVGRVGREEDNKTRESLLHCLANEPRYPRRPVSASSPSPVSPSPSFKSATSASSPHGRDSLSPRVESDGDAVRAWGSTRTSDGGCWRRTPPLSLMASHTRLYPSAVGTPLSGWLRGVHARNTSFQTPGEIGYPTGCHLDGVTGQCEVETVTDDERSSVIKTIKFGVSSSVSSEGDSWSGEVKMCRYEDFANLLLSAERFRDMKVKFGSQQRESCDETEVAKLRDYEDALRRIEDSRATSASLIRSYRDQNQKQMADHRAELERIAEIARREQEERVRAAKAAVERERQAQLKAVEDERVRHREKEEREARERAERETRERTEREARERAERETREKAERETRERAEREMRDREREAAEKDALERERQEREKAVKEQERKNKEERDKASGGVGGVSGGRSHRSLSLRTTRVQLTEAPNYVEFALQLKEELWTYERTEMLSGDPTRRKEIKRAVRTTINQVAGSAEQINKTACKMMDLMTQLQGDPSGYHFALHCTALTALTYVEDMILPQPKSVWPIAYLLNRLVQQVPVLYNFLFAKLSSECSYMIPVYLPKTKDMTMAAFKASRGQRGDESDVKFFKRTAGVLRLWLALLITERDHESLWSWYARFLNHPKPRQVAPSLLVSALEVSAFRCNQVYPRQFPKVLNYIMTFLFPKLEKHRKDHPDECAAAVNSAQLILEIYRHKGQLPDIDSAEIRKAQTGINSSI